MTTENIEKVEISESITIENLLEGADLSDDSKAQIATVFEGAVSAEVTSQVDVIAEQLRVDYEERLEEGVREQVTAYRTELVEKVDSFLNSIVESWLETNKLVIESEAKVALAEQFFAGMKTMLESVNLQIDETKLGALDESVSVNATLEAAYNTTLIENAELKAELLAGQKKAKLTELAEGMTAVDSAKLYKLAESIGEQTTLNEFADRLGAIKETFWAKPATPRAKEEAIVENVETGTVKAAPELSPIEQLAERIAAIKD